MRSTLLLTRIEGVLVDAATGALCGAAAGRVLGWPAAACAAGLLAGLLVGLRWTVRRAARAVEASRPETRHALTAWLEGGGGSLRPRLEAWLAPRIGVPFLAAGFLRLAFAAALFALARPPSPPVTPALAPPAPDPPPPAVLAVRVEVEPPRYTGQASFASSGPKVEAWRGSQVTLDIESSASQVTLAEAGAGEKTLPLAARHARESFVLDRTRTLRVIGSDGEGPLVVTLEARPDRPPNVELTSPDADRVVTQAPPPLAVEAVATDDIGVAALSLQYTLAQGTGESIRFKNGTLATRPRGDTGSTLKTVLRAGALGMGPGDTLVVWAEASDGNAVDGPAHARSTARIVRWDVPVAEMTAGSSATPPPPRSLLTQRELLARTEKLVKRGLRGAALEAASADLAQDQRALRTSFSQVLSTEEGNAIQLDVEEKEAAESTDTRAHALLAKAVSAMWESESELSISRPRASLAPQRAAVKALDEAFQLARLSLRPPARPDKSVDESRRLSGKTAGLVPRVATPPSPPAIAPQLVALAVDLIGAGARGLDESEAKALGDALWKLPATEGVPTAELASALYGAADAAARADAARLAGEALARVARPARTSVPARDPSSAAILGGVPLSPPRR